MKSSGDMYQKIKTLKTLGARVCIEIKFPTDIWTDHFGFQAVALTTNYQNKWRNRKGSQKNKTDVAVNINLFEADRLKML